ncbi:uncharacterized protein UMAG_02573 [Mycosarcoma maydis]|uniref:Uncharacterized protein n=1 Tax=Mycosarcoma maydis TaxID=5270 RepID=A0A0D1DYU2_MYCMD|nr:uncharacterized protein UMAG_02573 [Ustilago maydis 521]KIS69224.1 hypothetical protein UMAG_02573 [Ustilago maydis 521]|eukprot:XP_011388976.1 hypothetical protein UMAG_02573 [Ustilago maydis 521]
MPHRRLRDAAPAERDTYHAKEGADEPHIACIQQLPAPLQRYLQPFDASIGELTDAYNFKHMSDLISYLKSKVLEQKRLLSLLKNDFDRELAAVRKENLALKADVQALRSRPLKVEADITCNESPPLTQTSTGGSEIFAFKPPPLPFRAISPKTFMARASIRDSPRMQPGSLPSSHSHLRTPSNPQERFKRVSQSPLQRHVAHGTHSYQYAQPSSRTAVSLFQSPRSTPSLARTEDQPPQRAQTHSWHSAAAAGPTQQ